MWMTHSPEEKMKWFAVMAIPLAVGLLTTDALAQQQQQQISRLPRNAHASVDRPNTASRPQQRTRSVYDPVLRDEACNLPSSGCTNDKRDAN